MATIVGGAHFHIVVEVDEDPAATLLGGCEARGWSISRLQSARRLLRHVPVRFSSQCYHRHGQDDLT